MAKKAGKLTDLPTACRFAVLEVSDDSEEDEKQVMSKTDSKAAKKSNTDSSSASSKKKKQKKRRHKNKTNQADGLEEIELPSNQNPPNTKTTGDDWEMWQNRDEQFVLEQFQKDLQAALEASKTTVNFSKSEQENDLTSNKKKKKEKTISLDEFISGNTDAKNQVETNGNISRFDGNSLEYGLDDFQDERITEPVQDVQDEKPQKTKRKKKSHEKSFDEEAAKRESEHKDHKVISASNEESIKAEMVHVQEELSKQEDIVNQQRKTIDKQKGWISDLQKELVQVKKRNKQLCHILGQGEMKEKAELLLQIEELNEVREQVVQLHAELEQERSKSSALKHELAKYQTFHGRTRHGSTS